MPMLEKMSAQRPLNFDDKVRVYTNVAPPAEALDEFRRLASGKSLSSTTSHHFGDDWTPEDYEAFLEEIGKNSTEPEPEILTREQMRLDMRVMLPNGSMHGTITAITDEGISVYFDGRTGPMDYKWKNANFLVREK